MSNLEFDTDTTPRTPSKINFFIFIAASVAAIGGFLFGFDTGIIAGAMLYIQKQFNLSSTMHSVIVSASLIGAVIGSGASGWFANYFGRKRMLMAATFIFIVGTLSSTFSNTIPELIISRFVLGLAIGIESFVTPLYISEVAPTEYRGGLVSLTQLAITIGIFTSYLVTAHYAEAHAWHSMFCVGIIPALLLVTGLFYLPQSPRWLCMKGLTFEAFHTLRKIRQTPDVSEEIDSISESVNEPDNWKMLFSKWLRPVMIVGIGLGFFQQVTGINTIIYYAPTIFRIAGFPNNEVAIMATLGIGAINVLSTIIAIPLIDKLGRKPLLYFGMSVMMVSLFLLSFSFAFKDILNLQWVALASLLVYVTGFAVSLGPIMWLMFTEIFPLKVRAFGMSIVTSIQWLFNFMVSLTFLPFIEYLHESITFSLYATLCFLGILFVYYKVPETAGVSLEKIEHNVWMGLPSRDLGKK